ncbi:DUF3108 domain-containing protein [Belnapia rosea]|uniref:DUF3108 domain-containing protein n=1 Tax=Belnapia rosea TaxID=938405 RepID=UPI000880C97A|nr:DUF3108 domain-containing protein [Belnapia rosea]SDB52961.1 Protein of unknown function [Belnapia rosea]
MGRHLTLALGLALLPAAARAEPLLAQYDVQAAGMTVMKVEALLDLDGPRYFVRTRIRMNGMAGFFARGDQVTSAEGAWRGLEPVPARYQLEGTWRGERRVVVMDYGPGSMPRLRAIEPPNAGEREPVPESFQAGTMDALSALAKLTRVVGRTGRCDTEAKVYDGRRRADYSVRTLGQGVLQAEGGFGGPALKCAFEGRVLAGFRGDQDAEEARRPQSAEIWLGQPLPGTGPLPVRVELSSRWFGTIRAVLTSVEPAGSSQALAQQRR